LINRAKNVQNFIDKVEAETFDITGEEAIEKSICISCKAKVDLTGTEEIDQREYQISQLCPVCFDAACDEEQWPEGPDRLEDTF